MYLENITLLLFLIYLKRFFSVNYQVLYLPEIITHHCHFLSIFVLLCKYILKNIKNNVGYRCTLCVCRVTVFNICMTVKPLRKLYYLYFILSQKHRNKNIPKLNLSYRRSYCMCSSRKGVAGVQCLFFQLIWKETRLLLSVCIWSRWFKFDNMLNSPLRYKSWSENLYNAACTNHWAFKLGVVHKIAFEGWTRSRDFLHI